MDRPFRTDPRGNSPENLVYVGRVNVIIHGDDISSRARSPVQEGSSQAGYLAGVPVVALLERNDADHAIPRAMDVNALDADGARLFQTVPQRRGGVNRNRNQKKAGGLTGGCPNMMGLLRK